IAVSSYASKPRPRADAVGHVYQFDPSFRDQGSERAVAALKPEAQRALVRLAAEDALGQGLSPAPPCPTRTWPGRRCRYPVERRAQDLHAELMPARVVVVEGQPAEALVGLVQVG